jgi:hypothetical protein
MPARAPGPARPEAAKAVELPATPGASLPQPPVVVWVGVALGLLALGLYLVTLDTSLPTGDSGELISAAAVLGVAHPPGYPLFTLLGRFALLFPIGSPALRVNAVSALLDAAAVSVVYFAIHAVLEESGDRSRAGWNAVVAAAFGALLLAFSSTFWAYATVAEVFPLNDLFAASLLLLAFRWARRPVVARRGWLALFVLGLSFCDQPTIVLLIPTLAVLAWWGVRRLRASVPGWRPRARTLAIGLAAFLAGLAPYIYIPIAASRRPLLDWDNPTSVGRFVDLILRKNYGTLSLGMGAASGSLGGQLSTLFGNLSRGFLVIGLLLALGGVVWAWRSYRAVGAALVLGFVVSGPVFLAYANPDLSVPVAHEVISRFYVLPAIMLAVLAGLGAYATLSLLGRPSGPGVWGRIAPLLGAAVLLGVVAASAAAHYAGDDRRGDAVELNFADDLLESLPRNAIFLSFSDEYWEGITYAQAVDHVRTDVIALDAPLLGEREYALQMRREHPTLALPLLPFDSAAAYDTFIRANLGTHAVFYDGLPAVAGFGGPFERVYDGLVIRLVSKGSIRNPYALFLTHATTYEHLHYPTRTYPSTSWEALIAQHYAVCAFSLGLALSSRRHVDIAVVERLDELSINLFPSFADAYLNLGTLLLLHGGAHGEIESLWRRYLLLSPTGSGATAVRRALLQLELGASG